MLAAWASAGQRFSRPRVHATAARCRALIAASRGDLEAGLGHAHDARSSITGRSRFRSSARAVSSCSARYSGAPSTRPPRAARSRKPWTACWRWECRFWAERPGKELARVAVGRASVGLTPTEERVAGLVAEGRSNKEVADALFVSVRTVEANLTRIYAKLGIRSRTELAQPSRALARPRAHRFQQPPPAALQRLTRPKPKLGSRPAGPLSSTAASSLAADPARRVGRGTAARARRRRPRRAASPSTCPTARVLAARDRRQHVHARRRDLDVAFAFENDALGVVVRRWRPRRRPRRTRPGSSASRLRRCRRQR